MFAYLMALFFIASAAVYLAIWLIRDERPRLPWEINWDKFGKFVGWLVLFAVAVMSIVVLLNLAAA